MFLQGEIWGWDCIRRNPPPLSSEGKGGFGQAMAPTHHQCFFRLGRHRRSLQSTSAPRTRMEYGPPHLSLSSYDHMYSTVRLLYSSPQNHVKLRFVLYRLKRLFVIVLVVVDSIASTLSNISSTTQGPGLHHGAIIDALEYGRIRNRSTWQHAMHLTLFFPSEVCILHGR